MQKIIIYTYSYLSCWEESKYIILKFVWFIFQMLWAFKAIEYLFSIELHHARDLGEEDEGNEQELLQPIVCRVKSTANKKKCM